MRTVVVDPDRPDAELIAEAASVILRGGLVAFPTETVYGLGANALDEAAVRRIFEAKGRPAAHPIIAHVADSDGARQLAAIWPKNAVRLAEAFWPGPLTLVLPKRSGVPDILTAGLPKVAIRVPAHPVALALIRAAGVPIAAPSANRFTELSPTAAVHVERSLGEAVDLIVDGGVTSVGIESTVVDVSGNRPVLLRPGMLTVEDLAPHIGFFGIDTAPRDPSAARPSPGMHERHYAPRARLVLFDSATVEEATAIARRALDRGERVAAVVMTVSPVDTPYTITMPKEPGGYARRLYAVLHEMDELGCAVIVVERPPATAAWAGVLDRLTRAANQGDARSA